MNIEIAKLMYSLKEKDFTDETLQLYNKHAKISKIVLQPSQKLYKKMSHMNIEKFIRNFSNKRYFTMRDDITANYRNFKRKDFETIEKCLIFVKIEEPISVFKFGQKYVFLNDIIIKKFYEIENYTLIEIEFKKEKDIFFPINKLSHVFDKEFVKIVCQPYYLFCSKKDITYKNIFLKGYSKNFETFGEPYCLLNENNYYSIIFKIYRSWKRNLGKFYLLEEDQFNKIIDKELKNFSNFKDKINIGLATDKSFYHKIKRFVKEVDFLDNKFTQKNSELKIWAENNTKVFYNCCEEVMEYMTFQWPNTRFQFNIGKFMPYSMYFLNSVFEAREKVQSLPVGTFLYRGIQIPKGAQLKLNDKAMSSFSLKIDVALSFADFLIYNSYRFEEDVDKVIFYYQVKEEDNLKSTIFDEKINVDDKSGSEFIIPENSILELESVFKFNNCDFIKIKSINFEEKEIYIDPTFEEFYQLKNIVKNKDCFLTFRNFRENIFCTFYFDKTQFSKEEYNRIMMIENINLKNIYFSEAKNNFPNFNTGIYQQMLGNNFTLEKFNILQIKKEKIKEYLNYSYSNQKKDFLNFILQNYEKNKIFRK